MLCFICFAVILQKVAGGKLKVKPAEVWLSPAYFETPVSRRRIAAFNEELALGNWLHYTFLLRSVIEFFSTMFICMSRLVFNS